MCNFWSAILSREGTVLWDRDLTSHEDLISKFGLNDAKLTDRDFVRIEVSPKLGKIASKKKADWSYKVDEQGTLPDWYANDPMKMEKLVWAEWKNAMSQTLWKFRLEKIEDVLNEIRAIEYFKQKGEPLPEWQLSIGKTLPAAVAAARAAAWDAAVAAAGDAARDAAVAAAGAAAGDAARDAAVAAARAAARDAAVAAARAAAVAAARAAAGDAARDAAVAAARAAAGDAAVAAARAAAVAAARAAAGDAAWAAAWAAAGDAGTYAVIYITDPDAIDETHRKHVNDRMEVWRRGYGLYCDVNGKLYVYGVDQ